MNKLKVFALLIVCNMVFLFHLAAASADTLSIPVAALLPKDNTVTWTTNGGNFYSTSNSSQTFFAPVYLPDKAIIRSITLEAYDNSGGAAGGYVQLELLEYQYNAVVSVMADINTDQPGAPGDTRVVLNNIDQTVNNFYCSYGISVIFHPGPGGWGELRLYKVVIEYDTPQVTISG